MTRRSTFTFDEIGSIGAASLACENDSSELLSRAELIVATSPLR